MFRILVVAILIAASTVTYAGDLRIATFNTESDADTSPIKVGEQIKQIGAFDILAVQEVESAAALRIYTDAAAAALGGRWRYVISESATYSDRESDLLGIVYNTDLFRQLETTEIHLVRSRPDGSAYGQPDWGLRGALVLRLQDKASQAEFRIVTLHLKCCGAPGIRAHQANLLAGELNKEAIPTIVLGDSNIPVTPGQPTPDAQNLPAFASLSSGMGLSWLVPSNPIKTQCDPAHDSMLDQIYVPPALAAASTAEIKFTQGDYCTLDAQGFSDHRPVLAVVAGLFGGGMYLETNSSPALPASADELEEREFKLQQLARPDDSVGH